MGLFGYWCWGRLYPFFTTSDSALAKAVGPGGHFLVTTALLLLAWVNLQAVPESKLFLEDEDKEGEGATREEPEPEPEPEWRPPEPEIVRVFSAEPEPEPEGQKQ